ncbi:MAG: hypothetical protein ACOH19_17535 [Rhodoglobus sp.]
MGSENDGAMNAAASKNQRASRAIRWVLIIVLLLGAATSIALFGYQICESGVGSATTSCRTPGITDSITILFFALVAALLWPDVAEFGLFGFSVKRKAEEALTEARSAKTTAERIETQTLIQSIRLEQLSTSTATASSEAHFHYYGNETLQTASEELPSKIRAFNRGVKAPATKSKISPPSDQQVGMLIRLWSEIADRLEILGASARWYDVHNVGAGDAEKRAEFARTFEEELKLVRSVRNSVAHGRGVSSVDLEKAITVALQLRNELARIDESNSYT